MAGLGLRVLALLDEDRAERVEGIGEIGAAVAGMALEHRDRCACECRGAHQVTAPLRCDRPIMQPGRKRRGR